MDQLVVCRQLPVPYILQDQDDRWGTVQSIKRLGDIMGQLQPGLSS